MTHDQPPPELLQVFVGAHRECPDTGRMIGFGPENFKEKMNETKDCNKRGFNLR
jgi:hypothetical protein